MAIPGFGVARKVMRLRKKRRLIDWQPVAMISEPGQDTRDIRSFHESASRHDLEEVILQGHDVQRSSRGNVRHWLRAHREQINLLVEHFVVPNILEERGRRDIRMLREKDGATGCPALDGRHDLVDELH